MFTRKQIAYAYNCQYKEISRLLKKHNIIVDNNGPGGRFRITPHEFELLKKAIGEPLKSLG